jgi:hypothetical protein
MQPLHSVVGASVRVSNLMCWMTAWRPIGIPKSPAWADWNPPIIAATATAAKIEILRIFISPVGKKTRRNDFKFKIVWTPK